MKKIAILILGTIITNYSLMAQSDDGRLTVVVNNIENVEGDISVVLYDVEENFLKKGKVVTGKVTSKEAKTLVFEGLTDGTYAVSVIHDRNSSGDLDKGMFGIPVEPYGFSNDATGSFGPPSFEDSAFEFSTSKTIEITLN